MRASRSRMSLAAVRTMALTCFGATSASCRSCSRMSAARPGGLATLDSRRRSGDEAALQARHACEKLGPRTFAQRAVDHGSILVRDDDSHGLHEPVLCVLAQRLEPSRDGLAIALA